VVAAKMMSINRHPTQRRTVKQQIITVVETSNLLLGLFAAAIAGALIQILGGLWGVSWHLLGLLETFFTAPHTIPYSCVMILPWIIPLLAGGFAAEVIWIGLNKLITARMQAVDLGNSILPTQTEGTKKG
jgi:hypothetical protein